MSFELKDIQEAYDRLRTYIYYDNTDLILRLKLVEFETGDTKDWIESILGSDSGMYRENMNVFTNSTNRIKVEEKLEKLTEAINLYDKGPEFFIFFLNKIEANVYPKKFVEDNDENIITNQRTKEKYELNRVSAFIDAPIEIHIIS